MAEAAGLALGILGIAGLFKSCVENFDIIVSARNFGEEFDLICTQAIDRPDIRPTVEKALNHLCSLLAKADVITERYELKEEETQIERSSSNGLAIFRQKFESFRRSIRRNQKQKSTWKVTRWAVHDLPKFRALVEEIRDLIDGLEGVTSSLGVLERQQALLVKEVESISDTQSLRLLQEVASSRGSQSLRLLSDAASARLSIVRNPSVTTTDVAPTALTGSSSSTSYHTAPSRPAQRSVNVNVPESQCQPNLDLAIVSEETASPPLQEDVPQHQRIMADLLRRKGKSVIRTDFSSGDDRYGAALAGVKKFDDRLWADASPNLLLKANDNNSAARRAFLELRSIRESGVPFISASPVGDSLDKILASIEGPPDTPYEGGVFWISVKIPADGSAPILRFQTRIYHPNINSTGKICADYETWWTDPNLGKYMRMLSQGPDSVWFSKKASNHFSLGALLTALCNLLANPNIEDPLVPEIAEVYITDYERYCEAARLYTLRHANSSRPADGQIIFEEGCALVAITCNGNEACVPELNVEELRETRGFICTIKFDIFHPVADFSVLLHESSSSVSQSGSRRFRHRRVLPVPPLPISAHSDHPISFHIESEMPETNYWNSNGRPYSKTLEMKKDVCIFTKSSWLLPGPGPLVSSDFEMRPVGGSECNQVFRATKKNSGRVYAIKRIDKSITSATEASGRQPVQLRSSISDSPYFTDLAFAFQDSSHVYLGVNYISRPLLPLNLAVTTSGGALTFGPPFSPIDVLIYAAEMVIAMERLERSSSFWNIKPGHLRKGPDGHMIISNFGFVAEPPSVWDGYSAPETVLDTSSQWSRPQYLWTLGCFIFHLTFGQAPFAASPGDYSLTFPIDGIKPVELIRQLVVLSPSRRLGAVSGWQAVRDHDYFSGLTSAIWSDLEEKMTPFSCIRKRLIQECVDAINPDIVHWDDSYSWLTSSNDGSDDSEENDENDEEIDADD
ncbi:hypothetical protein QBC47DRAFT_459326 [Echria macrotheca]|uniref:UBC core domain-containing protein n=1 Tax=Echria macrotheca TaxID=438768 RepID=A0AAJ0BHA1_9PEZI|nr:hypothetical protein QBC47DRAFT_459326 [Echria macrotheca]